MPIAVQFHIFRRFLLISSPNFKPLKSSFLQLALTNILRYILPFIEHHFKIVIAYEGLIFQYLA